MGLARPLQLQRGQRRLPSSDGQQRPGLRERDPTNTGVLSLADSCLAQALGSVGRFSGWREPHNHIGIRLSPKRMSRDKAAA